MSSKQVHIVVGFGLSLLIALAVIQGCGEITGEFYANQRPIVEFVNVPQNAYGIDTTNHYGMPFTVDEDDPQTPIKILDMQGALMIADSEKVYGLSASVPPDTMLYSPGVDYEMDYEVIVEDDTIAFLTPLEGGGLEAGESYLIDFQFTIGNYYLLSFAPTVYWKGSDPDGFVEYYRYADMFDPEFISGFRLDPDGYFAQHQNELNWVDTTSMNSRIYLLTETGDTTEHVVFVKAVDNEGMESDYDFKTLFRTNNPPNNPTIKPLEAADTEYAQHYVLEDTLFSLNELTPLWQGISFNWRSDDPDDMELYQIPLEYTYFLLKTPGDTLWDHSNPEWSETNQIQLFGLETGSYVFTVWVRDDGLTLSAEPATIQFNVIKPTFEHHILLVDETLDDTIFEVPGTLVTDFWLDLLSTLEGTLEIDNYVMDGVDVRLVDNSSSNTNPNCPIPRALVGQYKLVIIFAADNAATNSTYITNRNDVLADYLDMGGNLWFIGRRVLSSEFGLSTNIELPVPTFLADYMQLEIGFSTNVPPAFPIEFTGALPVIQDQFPELKVDTARVALIFDPANTTHEALMEVDWFTRSDDANTLYIFNSNTADTVVTNPYVYSEDSPVLPAATQEQAVILPLNPGILAVYRVENFTKGILGTIESFNADTIRVSYQGEPWTDEDVLLVDYKYDPISDMHLKPVVVRYEATPRVIETIDLGEGLTATIYRYSLGFRTSIFSFPLFFMDNSNGEVDDLTRTMLEWYFYPTIHW